MNCFKTEQTMRRRGEEELELELVSWQILIWEQKSLRLYWLSWLAPSFVVKVRPSGFGLESWTPPPTTVSFVWATNYNDKLPHCLFSGDFLLRFALDRFRLDPAGKSSRTFYSDEATRKKSCSLFVLCCGAESETAYCLPVDWEQVWECLAIF